VKQWEKRKVSEESKDEADPYANAIEIVRA
jgi:hypothetical protein